MNDKALYILQYWESDSHVEQFMAISESPDALKQIADGEHISPIKWFANESEYIGSTESASYYRISQLKFFPREGVWLNE